MNKTSLKQGTLAWDNARATRIGSSEVFDIVRYYATDDELQNCGFNAEAVRAEKPYTTAWALYHKMLNDGIFQREELPPELAEYGHAVEPYGVRVLQEGRKLKLKPGVVYADERLIASLDISGVSEEADERPFDYGTGMAKAGKRFVAEQKSIMPNVLKNGLPIKHIIQAQYQITMTGADFFILQIMVLHNDTTFERGRITQMPVRQRDVYLKDTMDVKHLYFQNNEPLSMLIQTCLKRFFDAVDKREEPTPFIATDSQRNIIDSIRINSFYNKDLTLSFDLSEYISAKSEADAAEERRKSVLQGIVETAKEFNAVRFRSEDGAAASFSAAGAFLVKPPRGAKYAED